MNYSSKHLTDEFNKLFEYAQDYYDGISKLLRIKPSVTIFGSARASVEDKYYDLSYNISAELVNKNFGIITGGGPGLMEAANRAASDNLGSSTGVNVVNDLFIPPFVDKEKNVRFKNFAYRKLCMLKISLGFVILPGGLGTIDEFFETITLIQIYNTRKVPIILVGKEFWSGLLEWMYKVKDEYGYITKDEMTSFVHTDNPKEIAEIFTSFYRDKVPEMNF
ncbi:MAG: TIGR00730 family Rossman fold protein [bacterium]